MSRDTDSESHWKSSHGWRKNSEDGGKRLPGSGNLTNSRLIRNSNQDPSLCHVTTLNFDVFSLEWLQRKNTNTRRHINPAPTSKKRLHRTSSSWHCSRQRQCAGDLDLGCFVSAELLDSRRRMDLGLVASESGKNTQNITKDSYQGLRPRRVNPYQIMNGN